MYTWTHAPNHTLTLSDGAEKKMKRIDKGDPHM